MIDHGHQETPLSYSLIVIVIGNHSPTIPCPCSEVLPSGDKSFSAMSPSATVKLLNLSGGQRISMDIQVIIPHNDNSFRLSKLMEASIWQRKSSRTPGLIIR
ncbi:hypothetical protein [Fictibacillus sp. FJAT-27399]|uniref:hypothetical protein n=1 Tax=Fictibacillus sp. FJAT-27399 TaxID=1729689 RepID=UPI0012E3B6BE